MPTIDLSATITYLPGVGEQRMKLLRDQMQISTLEHLLTYFPSKHIDRSRLYTIGELTQDMPFVQLRGQIIGWEEEGLGRKRRLVAHFTDGHGVVDLVWFNGINYVTKNYKFNTTYIVFGRPSVFGGRFNISHPEIETADRLELNSLGLRPYYTMPEKLKKRGINSHTIEKLVNTLLDRLPGPIPETLPQHIVEAQRLMGRDEAIRAMHHPKDSTQLTRATYRLKFEELFYIQLSILRYSRDRKQRYPGRRFTRIGEAFNGFYFNHLPFQLTEAQKRVIREMRADMLSGQQMNRLLQGDVGSGKTMVALMAMLIAVDNGHQACIMAPTEILAEQHLETFRNMLGDMPVRVELLTGQVKGKRRQAVLEALAAGEIDILVGTHALIEDWVKFSHLGLVVIDEQHRFGVAQRAKMWAKVESPPHVLVMTATPIPRTLAMTLYGDLDVSVIDELPPGRKPVTTLHHYFERRSEMFQLLIKQLEMGRQAYFVYPLIEESEKVDLMNLERGYEELCNVLPNVPIGKVHGKMKATEKDEQMRLFASGKTRILVSTTVIEVGVNVPNATVMIVENADRFGLAQLHQLRGRVGRGADQSFCILVTGYKLSSDTRRRIQIMTETNDGFEIAEADMKLRGPGDLEGTQQSGMAFDLRVANLARDGQVVQQARDVARQVLDADPDGTAPHNAVMWERLRQLKKGTIDWSSIA